MLLAALGSGFGELQLLLIPLGLTLLVLARVFHTELSPGAGVKLRAWGMGLMYVAVAWKPLTVTALPALVLCVVVCLGGVALGALWRIRSYVVLGSGVLVTTVLATLVRSGLAEPRLGAVFLSLLGLTVVVVMVAITTKREELQARLASMQRVMATWEGWSVHAAAGLLLRVLLDEAARGGELVDQRGEPADQSLGVELARQLGRPLAAELNAVHHAGATQGEHDAGELLDLGGVAPGRARGSSRSRPRRRGAR